MSYLKEEIYYVELYDKHTIEECRRWETQLKKPSGKHTDEKLIERERQFAEKVMTPLAMVFIQGERYRNKAETVRTWMDRDRKRDEKLASAIEPSSIRFPFAV